MNRTKNFSILIAIALISFASPIAAMWGSKIQRMNILQQVKIHTIKSAKCFAKDEECKNQCKHQWG